MMNRSESIEELATALVAAQGEIQPAKKSATNPHLRITYATLDDIIEAVREPLTNHGLSFLQMLDHNDQGPVLKTTLLHESGQWLESETLLIASMDANRGTNQIQAFGGTLTYYRRYALSAMLGVSSDEDADGHKPQRKQGQPQGHGKQVDQDQHWIDDDQTRRRFWAWAKDNLTLSEDQVYEALEVDSIHDFCGNKKSAMQKIMAWTKAQTDEEPSEPDKEPESDRLDIDVQPRK